MSGTFMRYNFQGIDAGFTELLNFVKFLDNRLEKIEADCAPIVATWESEARDAYDVKKASWNASAEKIRDVIVKVGNALASSGEEMQAVDKMNAAKFGG